MKSLLLSMCILLSVNLYAQDSDIRELEYRVDQIQRQVEDLPRSLETKCQIERRFVGAYASNCPFGYVPGEIVSISPNVIRYNCYLEKIDCF